MPGTTLYGSDFSEEADETYLPLKIGGGHHKKKRKSKKKRRSKRRTKYCQCNPCKCNPCKCTKKRSNKSKRQHIRKTLQSMKKSLKIKL